MTMITTIDDRDWVMISRRAAAYDRQPGIRVGDWVDFADNVRRRVSHIWTNPDGSPDSVQTSDGGSFYLGSSRSGGILRGADNGEAHVSFSGSLYSGIDPATLTLTGERRDGRVWVFHHDYHTAHNGVDAMIPFRVFVCSEPANRCPRWAGAPESPGPLLTY